MDGIYTLANDRVCDQLVALLNSIEVNAGPHTPVCILPYDDRLDRVREQVSARPGVELYEDRASIERWESFVTSVWESHPTARERWPGTDEQGLHRGGTHRRLCAFDGPFDRFLYMDADTLLLSDPAPVLERLDDHDWVVYDFQHRDLSHVFDATAELLAALFTERDLRERIFCSGFYASHRGRMDPSSEGMRTIMRVLLDGESAVLYPMAPDQSILNYLVLRTGLRVCNLALSLPPEERTGNAVTSDHFSVEGGRVLDRGRPLTYIHYIGVPADLFQRLCRGENVDFPYREAFLHYRYPHEPGEAPPLRGPRRPYRPTRWQRLLFRLWDQARGVGTA